MYESKPMTGAPCDTKHPFPRPRPGDWADSMEYGDLSRIDVDSDAPTYDRDTSPLWRAVAAYLWNINCRERHVAQVVADPILTAYAVAVATVTDGVASSEPALALRAHGLEGCRRVIDKWGTEARTTEVESCVIRIMRGYTALKVDLWGQFDH